MLRVVAAWICFIWYLIVTLVCSIGIIQLFRWYSTPPKQSKSASQGDNAPHVTIIRPCKGLDTELSDCLAATFHQTYPSSRLTIYFCVETIEDEAVPIIKDLLKRYPKFDAHLFVEKEDGYLLGKNSTALGPNPKIRSISRAYREAKGDLVWMIDCNVWVNTGTCGRLVDLLLGLNGNPPHKFVHQLPIVVDRSSGTDGPESLGGRFEEAWFSSAHAKFYTAINTVVIAPCIVGKSNMFRKSHLNAITEAKGTDYFSHSICEDHLIGDLFWRTPVPNKILDAQSKISGLDSSTRKKWGNHAMDFGDLAVQPVKAMTISQFWSRRVRWLRVRKFTVLAATLVEHGTESIVCSLYGAYALTTLPLFTSQGIPQSWLAFWVLWSLSMILWAFNDFFLFRFFETGLSIEIDKNTPDLALYKKRKYFERKSFPRWFIAWLSRELLTFPIWFWAVFGGMTVVWRGRRFRVDSNLRAKEVIPENSKSFGKSRMD